MDGAKKLTKGDRIDQRRKRVEAKRIIKDSDANQKEEEVDEEVSKSKAQTTASRLAVESAVAVATVTVSNVSVDREAKEAERRRKEAGKRKERLEKLEKELLESTAENREIEVQWIDVAKNVIPQELHQEIGKQFQQANGILSKKNVLMKDLQRELKEQDEEHVELLAQHQEDIVQVVKHMQKEFHMYLTTCEKQLDVVEIAFLDERKELLEQCKREIEDMFKKREGLENDIVKTATDREKLYQNELNKIRSDDAEDYNSLKVTLENNIQLLEQQLEQMRATYQLNSEKLEYNHSVLEERDAENKTKMDHHRQRHRQLKEALSAAIQKCTKEDHRMKQENTDLTEDYMRVTEQYKTLQKKFRHFEMADQVKFKEVWDMKEAECMDIIRKVMAADKLIYEQILGTEWRCPITSSDNKVVAAIEEIGPAFIFNSVSDSDRMDQLEMQQRTRQMFGSVGNQGQGNLGASLTGSLDGTGTLGADGFATGDSVAAAAAVSASAGAGALPGKKTKYSSNHVKMILSIIANECSFLVDSRVKESIKGLNEDEQRLFKVDSILMALAIGDGEDLDELITFIMEEGASANAGMGAGDKMLVHPNDVVKRVKEWLKIRQMTKQGPGIGNVVSKASTSVEDDKMIKKKEKQRKFWRRMKGVIGEARMRVWDALEKGLRKYTALLEERQRLIEDTTDLARQNEELKILLQEYLGSKINTELEIPPTRLIRVDNRR